MKRALVFVFTGCVLFLLLSRCATTSHYGVGRAYLDRGEYDQAIRSFAAAVREEPANPLPWRELGVTLYERGDKKHAALALEKAFQRDSTDGRTLLYLGMVQEDQGDIGSAIGIYRRYMNLRTHTGLKDEIEAKLSSLIREKMQQEARAALADEQSLERADVPENTVAVLYFKNLGSAGGLDPLQKGLAEMLITDLSKVRSLRVVERLRLQKLLEEMGLGMTGLVDETTAPRMGKLLGAAQVVNGSFVNLSDARLRIDASIVQIRDRFFDSKTVEGKLLDLFRLEKGLVFDVVDGMGITLTPEERQEIRIIPTDNILAFMAYCRGLDLEDRGQFGQAAEQYQQSLKFDPNFSKAKENLKRSQVLSAGPEIKVAELVKREPAPDKRTEAARDAGTKPAPAAPNTSPAARPAADDAAALRASAVARQILRTGGILNQSFLPGIDARKPTQEQSSTSFGSSANFLIRIDLRSLDW